MLLPLGNPTVEAVFLLLHQQEQALTGHKNGISRVSIGKLQKERGYTGYALLDIALVVLEAS